jgi:hypothetical protein
MAEINFGARFSFDLSHKVGGWDFWAKISRPYAFSLFCGSDQLD